MIIPVALALSPAHAPAQARQPVIRVSIDHESPPPSAPERSLRAELAGQRAQSVGAGFMTVLGIVLASMSVPGVVATVVAGDLGASGEVVVPLAIGSAFALVGGLGMVVGGGEWWRASNRRAAELAAMLGEARLRPWLGPGGGGLVLSWAR